MPRGAWLGPVCFQRAPLPRASAAGQADARNAAAACTNVLMHRMHARARARARTAGCPCTARAPRARIVSRRSSGSSLRAHHSPDPASSRTRMPALRQRPPERIWARDFDRAPEEPGVCGLDGSGRAGERSGVAQLMRCRRAVRRGCWSSDFGVGRWPFKKNAVARFVVRSTESGNLGKPAGEASPLVFTGGLYSLYRFHN